MSTYTPFTKTDWRFMQKRLDEVLDRLQQRAYDINGELECMELDEDGKNWRQDAVLDIERYADELRTVVINLPSVVKTYKNAAPLTAVGEQLRIKDEYEARKEPDSREVYDAKAAARISSNKPNTPNQ